MLGNIGILRAVSSTSSWTYLISLIVCIIWKSHLQNQEIIWEEQVRCWLPILIWGLKYQTIKKAIFTITHITNQDFKIFFKKFKNLPRICYNFKNVNNEPTEAYFFLINHITKQIKIKKNIRLCTKEFNETIWHVNKKIGHVNKKSIGGIIKHGRNKYVQQRKVET